MAVEAAPGHAIHGRNARQRANAYASQTASTKSAVQTGAEASVVTTMEAVKEAIAAFKANACARLYAQRITHVDLTAAAKPAATALLAPSA